MHGLLDQTSLVRDLLVPILIERGNLRDLVSFLGANRRLYNLYRDIEQHCHSSMLAYRIISPYHYQAGYSGIPPSLIENIGHTFPSYLRCAVVALCDAALSIKKDTFLYLRLLGENRGTGYFKTLTYFYQICDSGVFRCGYRNNEIKQLLKSTAWSNYFILRH